MPTTAPMEGDHHHHHHTEGMPHDFSDAEYWTTVFDAPERDAWQMPEHVVRLMQVDPGMTLVDLGAGTGYFLSTLSQAAGEGGRVLALEVEENLVAFMRERAQYEALANVEARYVPYDDPQLAPESVDRILIVNTWHHIDDRIAYGGKLLAALRPAGEVFVVDFTMESERGPSREHRLTPSEVGAELEAAGFATEVVEESLPDQYVVVGRRP